MTILLANDVIQFKTSEGEPRLIYRLLHVAPQQDSVVLLRIVKDEKLKAPEIRSYSEIERLIEEGCVLISKFTPPKWMLMTEEQIASLKNANKYLEIRRRNFNLIKPLVENTPAIFDPAQRGPLVRQAALKANRSEKDYFRLIFRFWKYGMTPNAFLPSFLNCGHRGLIRRVGNAKRGRRNKLLCTEHANRPGINITATHRELIDLGIKAFYKSTLQHPISKAYSQTINTFFNDGMQERDGILVPVLLPDSEVPTYGQFRYWLKRTLDEITMLRSRWGERKWLLRGRGMRGTSRDGVFGPTAKYEIDSTIADVYLVSQYNRQWIIGRPVIYLVVDVYTRMIVGFHVSLTGPSWEDGARMALLNAFCDKVEFCDMYGVAIEPEDWPCFHLPHRVVADRGELVGHTTEGMIQGLGIYVDIAPPYRPDWKAIVERHFRILNEDTIKWMPGAVRARQKERGDRDYRLDAALTMHEFVVILIHSILKHNLYTERTDLLTDEMIQCNVNPYCVDMWLWGLENMAGSVRTFDRDTVFAHLLPSANATVDSLGILFHSMKYTCKRAEEENWFALARVKGSRQIEVRYDPNSADRIWILPEDGSSFESCRLFESETRYKNHRLEEVIDMLEYLKLQSKDRLSEKRQGDCVHDTAIGSVVKRALTAKSSTPSNVSKRALTSDIREKRSLEILAQKVLPAPGATHGAEEPEAIATTELNDNRHANILHFIKHEREKEEN